MDILLSFNIHMLSLNYKLLIHLKCCKAMSATGSMLTRPSSISYGLCLQGAPFLSSSRSKTQRGTCRPRACSPSKSEVGEVHHEPTTTATSISPASIKLERKSWPGGFQRLNDLGTLRLGKGQGTYRNMIYTTTQLAVRPTAVSQDLLHG